jgi:hypothetical protein
MSDTDESLHQESRSESEFQFHTPSEEKTHERIFKSPRSEDWETETVFVPLVHQSVTKTVWQSDEVILEEKEDADKK